MENEQIQGIRNFIEGLQKTLTEISLDIACMEVDMERALSVLKVKPKENENDNSKCNGE